MSAPAINTAPFAMPGMNAAAGAATGGQPGAVAGFDALLAALFPQVEATATTIVPTTTMAAPAPVDPLLATAADVQSADAEEPAAEAVAATDAATIALVADYMIPLAPAPVVETATPATAAPESAAPASAPFVPVAPEAAAEAALAAIDPEVQADAQADAGQVAADTAEAPMADAFADLPEGVSRPAQPPSDAAVRLPETFNSAGEPTKPQPPVAPKAAPAATDVAAEQPAEPAAVAVAAEQAASATAATFASKAEPNPAPARTAKNERKASAEPTATATAAAPEADAASPVVAAPAAAKPQGAVATAAQGPVEAVERKDGEAKATADAPDFTVQGETRATAASGSTSTEASAAPVRGAPETVANLAAQIVKKLEAKTTRFDVQLDPYGLGKVDVRVEIAANGRITAAMTFDSPQAAQDVKARANELQRALEQAGFDMSNGALSFDVAQDRSQGQGRAWQQQQDQNESGSMFRGQAFRAALETAGDAAQAANQGALRLSRGARSGLDVRI